jgi:hypothetical protein
MPSPPTLSSKAAQTHNKVTLGALCKSVERTRLPLQRRQPEGLPTVRGRDNRVESRMNRFIALLLLAVGLVLPAQAVLTGDIKSCSG